jgi:hypothetical protein
MNLGVKYFSIAIHPKYSDNKYQLQTTPNKKQAKRVHLKICLQIEGIRA